MIDANYPAIHISNEGDPADSSNHTLYIYVMKLLSGEPADKFVEGRKYFFDEKGDMRRHPSLPANSFTRDQLTPHLAFMALTGPHKPTIAYYNKIKANFGLFFNSYDIGTGPKTNWWDRDILDLQTRALFARAMRKDRWMHYLGDLNMVATMLYDECVRPDYNAQENLQMHLIVSALVMPTFISKWAFKYYFTRTKKRWSEKIFGFFYRRGLYYPEIPMIAQKGIRTTAKKIGVEL